jgi:signal transduction histidine kinase/CheY-like chemotaxis protein
MPRRIRWVEATTPNPSIRTAAVMRTSQDWQNIGRKLPLLTTALLTVAVTAISWTAYHEMRRTTVDAAGEHLLGVSRQIADYFADIETRLRREGTALSHDSVVARALATNDPSARAAALRKLTARANAANVYAVELWDAHGTRVLSAGNAAPETPNASTFTSVVNPLVIVNDSVLTDARVPVVGRHADTLGMLRELTRTSSAQSKQILGGLIGGKSILLVGNASGDVWTDLDRPVEGPPAGTARGATTTSLRDGIPWTGALSAVKGTPWVIWVARPQAEVLARVHGFLIRMLLVALGVVVLGGVGARLLSGHIIAPLSEVTHAAEAIAGGDYSIRLKPVRRDEVGRLAEAFTTMAASIEQASIELSDQALELEAQQTELQEANEELRQTVTAMSAAREAHKQLEAQLQQAQKMEAVGRLAGGVAHDFNNMLTVMISYTDLVLANNTVADDVRNDLKQVRSAADRAATLTRQLLAFSRKQVLRPSVVDVNEVVGGVTTMLARVMPENIRVSTTLGTGIEPVFVDRGQLEQVLMNLAVNARDAMAAGGALTIETSNAMLDDSYVGFHPGGAPGPHVVLSVRDTGIGMDAATRERIFEPFFTTKPVGQGTGLGLATVYGIVQQSGGSIYVYSEPGRGTIFKVYFPAHRAEQDGRTNAAPAPVAAVESMNVLLVEDDPAVRDATRVVLKSLGHTVTAAPDVAAGLALVRASVERFDVVLTDAVMPGQSGLELAEILRIERPDLPVILMSGYAEETINFDPSKMPGMLFIEKPFTAPTIARALGQVRAGSHARAHA